MPRGSKRRRDGPPPAARPPQRRKTAAQRGYSYRWQEYSKRYRRANPLCVMCLANGVSTPADCVDHIQAVESSDDALFWIRSNHQSLCNPCHSLKTQTTDKKGGRCKPRATRPR